MASFYIFTCLSGKLSGGSAADDKAVVLMSQGEIMANSKHFITQRTLKYQKY